MKSIREIAKEIIRSGGGRAVFDFDKAIDRVEQALRNERERAVKIIEDHRLQDVCNDNCWTTIKAAIRKED